VTQFDNNNQPEPGIHWANNKIKAANTLMGILLGITADNYVSDEEIHFLNLWLLDNEAHTNTFPLNVIKNRVDSILADGIITEDERAHLHQTLLDITGNDYHQTGSASGGTFKFMADNPNHVVISNSTFCLTGEFFAGTRKSCEQAIKKFGGIATKNVTKKTDYLVIGSGASRDWITQNYGTKIEKAYHYRENGIAIQIITEETFLNFITI